MENSRNRPPEYLVGHVARKIEQHRVHRLRIGLSGGLDSVVLAHLLAGLRANHALDLEVLHVHHGLSPQADAWAEQCREFCRDLDVRITIRRVNVSRQTGEGIEGEARRLRREALRAGWADWVALAHHRDDQAETLLANLLRGSGVLGASAMPAAEPPWWRPLLDVPRADLTRYAEQAGLTWCDDESNADPRFLRNFLRHQVLPLVEQRRPGASERLAQAANRFAEGQHLLDELARIDLSGNPACFPLPKALFESLDPARSCNLLRYVLRQAGLQSPDEPSLREFIRQVLTAGPDRHPLLRIGDSTVEVRRGFLNRI